MPNRPLPIQCPKCKHEGSTLVAESATVITLTCDSCQYSWSTDLEPLSPARRERIHTALRDA
jgi:transcription elongation factor Elf1